MPISEKDVGETSVVEAVLRASFPQPLAHGSLWYPFTKPWDFIEQRWGHTCFNCIDEGPKHRELKNLSQDARCKNSVMVQQDPASGFSHLFSCAFSTRPYGKTWLFGPFHFHHQETSRENEKALLCSSILSIAYHSTHADCNAFRSGGSRQESVSLPFSESSGQPHFLAHDLFLYIQSQKCWVKFFFLCCISPWSLKAKIVHF